MGDKSSLPEGLSTLAGAGLCICVKGAIAPKLSTLCQMRVCCVLIHHYAGFQYRLLLGVSMRCDDEANRGSVVVIGIADSDDVVSNGDSAADTVSLTVVICVLGSDDARSIADSNCCIFDLSTGLLVGDIDSLTVLHTVYVPSANMARKLAAIKIVVVMLLKLAWIIQCHMLDASELKNRYIN